MFVLDGTCTVTTLEENMDEIIFGLKYGPGGIPHMYSTSGALRFASANGLVRSYSLIIQRRHINNHHTRTCTMWWFSFGTSNIFDHLMLIVFL